MMQRLCAAIVIIATVTFPAFTFAAPPPWVEAFREGSLISPEAYFGVGMADFQSDSPDYECRRLSKDRALDELSYQLSVSITSLLKEKLSQKGDYSQEQVSSSLFVSTRKVLNGITVKEKWTDSGDRQYWVMLAIDKESAERQVKQQDFINEVVNRLEKKQAEINTGIKKLNTLLSDHDKRIDHRMHKMEDLLNRINKKITTAAQNPQVNYSAFMQKLEQVEKQWQKKPKDDQSDRLNDVIRQNQILTERLSQIMGMIQQDQFLSLLADDVKNQQTNGNFKVTIVPEAGPGADYTEGDTIRFKVSSNRDGYIKVIYTSSIGNEGGDEKFMNTLLFPNHQERDNRIKADITKTIGDKNELIVQPPFGKDVVTVIVSSTQFKDLDHLLTESEEAYYSFETHSTRGAVTARGIGVREKATDTCFIITRAE